MSVTYANITKNGANQNLTAADAAAALTNVGEEKYAMADNVKVVKTATGYKTIPFSDAIPVQEKIQSPDTQTSVTCADTGVSIVSGSSNIVITKDSTVSVSSNGDLNLLTAGKISVSDDVVISPLTNDGTKGIIMTTGTNPGTDGAYLELSPTKYMRIGSREGSDSSYIEVDKAQVKINVDDAGDVLTANNSAVELSSGVSELSLLHDGVITNTNTTVQYTADGTNTATVNKGILEDRLVEAPIRKIIKGFDDPYVISATFTNSTRTLTYSSSTGTCVYYADGNKYTVPNGDPKLSTVLPDLNQWNYSYFDSNGQLQSETPVTINTIRIYNLGSIIRFQKGVTPTTGVAIAGIYRLEAAQANEVENEASYETKSIIASERVLFESTLGGNVVGHTGGVYYSSRDKRFEFNPVAGSSKTWVKYYLDGIDDAGCNWAKASVSTNGIPYITDVDLGIGATGRLVYNSFNPALGASGEYEVLTVPLNDYTTVHYIVGDGHTHNVLCTMGQASYNSLADARAGIAPERQGLVFEEDVFRDVGIVASCIFSYDGELQYVDVDNQTLFDYPTTGVTSPAGSGTSTTLQTAYLNSVQPQTTTDATRGANQIKDGVGGGAKIFDVINGSNASVFSVSENGVDAGGSLISNSKNIVVSPLEYGAVADGATNDNSSFNLAFAASDYIDLKGKTYAISDITVPRVGITIYNGVLINHGSTESMLVLAGENNIQNVQFIGKGKASGLSGDIAIKYEGDGSFVGVGLNTINNCNFSEFGQSGVQIGNFVDSHQGNIISSCNFFDNNIGFESTTRGEYTNINGCTFARNTTGCDITGGNNSLNSCTISDNSTGIYLRAGSNDAHGVVAGCQINHNTLGIRDNGTITQTYSANNIYASPCEFGNAEYTKINSCVFRSGSNITLNSSSSGEFNSCLLGVSVSDNSGDRGWMFVNTHNFTTGTDVNEYYSEQSLIGGGTIKTHQELLGCRFDGANWIATQTEYPPQLRIRNLTNGQLVEYINSTTPSSVGDIITWVQTSVLDKDGIYTLPFTDISEIDAAGNKAVITKEYADSNYIAKNGDDVITLATNFDLNTLSTSGFYYVTSPVNGPGGSGFVEHLEVDSLNRRTQIFTSFNSKRYYRFDSSGDWAGDPWIIISDENTFKYNFKFTREGFTSGNYSGGDYDVPYTYYAEDGSANLDGRGVIDTISSRLKAVTIQFATVGGTDTTVTLKYKVNGGSRSTIGTFINTGGVRSKTFTDADFGTINFSAGDEILFSFSADNTNINLIAPTVTAYVWQQ